MIVFLLVKGSDRWGTRSSNTLRVTGQTEVLNFAVFGWRRGETWCGMLFWTRTEEIFAGALGTCLCLWRFSGLGIGENIGIKP